MSINKRFMGVNDYQIYTFLQDIFNQVFRYENGPIKKLIITI